MSQAPTPYDRQYNFTSFQSSNPTTPLPGQKVDQELNAARTTINATLSRLNEIQADDGKIRDSALNLTTISEATSSAISADAIADINAAASSAQTASVSAINTAGGAQVSSINAAGAAGVASINSAMQQPNVTTVTQAANSAQYNAMMAESYKTDADTARVQAIGAANDATNSMIGAVNKAAEAHQSAIDSANSAASASNYATNALNSYTNAANAANNALTYQQYAQQAKADAEAAQVAAQAAVDNAGAIIIGDVQDLVDDAAASATSAHNSANDALTSKTAAAGSATNAAASATAAATSASNASSSASNAATSASNASSSASSASSSGTYAATSATNAANSASAAAGSAATAATSASNAAQSASSASGYSANAQAAASSASSNASSASNSAAAAAASESNASGHASNASTYASNAANSASAAASSASSFSLSIGSVSTGSPGSSASASVSGTAPSYTLDLTIPTGSNGTNGASLTMRGYWSYGTYYAPGDVAVSGGNAYAAFNANYGYSDPASDPSNWASLTITGPQGAPGSNGSDGSNGSNGADGQSLTVVGTWTNGNTYYPGQVAVDPSNSLPYLCQTNITSYTNPQYDATNWVVLSINMTPKAIYSSGGSGGYTHTVQTSDPSTGADAEVAVSSNQYTYPVRLTPAGVNFNDGSIQITAGVTLSYLQSNYTTTSNIAGTYATITTVNGKLSLSGGTMTGKLIMPASSTTTASFNIPQGTAPTTPATGDIWQTTGGVLQFRANSVNRSCATLESSNTHSAGVKNTFSHANAGNAGLNIGGVSGTPTLAAGDVWHDIGTGVLQILGYSNSMRGAMTACRAFAQVTVTTGTPALSAGYNVSSITDNAVGDFTLNFTNAMVDTNFLMVGSTSGNAGNNGSVVVTARATTTCRVNTIWAGALADVANFSAAILR